LSASAELLVGVKDNVAADDNWSYKTCKAPVKLPPTNQQWNYLQKNDFDLLIYFGQHPMVKLLRSGCQIPKF